MITTLAAVKLIPIPPALVDNKKTSLFFSIWLNLSIELLIDNDFIVSENFLDEATCSSVGELELV